MTNRTRAAGLFASSAPMMLLAALAGCASHPPDTPAVPSWVRQSARTPGEGTIDFVESEDDVDPVAARAKAEGLALLDVANECSFVPKETRFVDRFQAKTVHLTQAHVLLRVDAKACDAAKKANALEAIRAQADPQAARSIALFQEKHGEPALESSGGDETKAYFMARQRLALLKQKMILGLPGGAAKPADPKVDVKNDAKSAAIRIATLEREAAKLGAEQAGSAKQNASVAWSRYRHELLRPRFGADGNPVVIPKESDTSESKPDAR